MSQIGRKIRSSTPMPYLIRITSMFPSGVRTTLEVAAAKNEWKIVLHATRVRLRCSQIVLRPQWDREGEVSVHCVNTSKLATPSYREYGGCEKTTTSAPPKRHTRRRRSRRALFSIFFCFSRIFSYFFGGPVQVLFCFFVSFLSRFSFLILR